MNAYSCTKIDAAEDLPPDPREPMTDSQAARLRMLCDRTGAEFDMGLTKRQAARYIWQLEESLA